MGAAAEVFPEFLQAAQSATDHAGAQEATIAVAGRSMRVVCAGQRVASFVMPAFSHRLSDQAEPRITVHVFDSLSGNVPLPASVRAFVADGRYGMPGAVAEDGVLTAFQRLDPGLSMYSPERRTAVCWVPSIETVPSEWQASPLRSVLHWWLQERRIQLMHVAAVGDQHGAVLIAGKGGSGKSTTALTCLLGGLRFLGDDFCAVALEPVPTVFSLYASAKVHRTNLARLPELADCVANSHRDPGEKAVLLFRQGEWPLAQCLPVRAIIAPSIAAAAQSSWAPVSGAVGLATLAPSTVLQLTSSGGDALRTMGSLARAVPTFALQLGSDRAGVVAAVREILDAANSR